MRSTSAPYNTLQVECLISHSLHNRERSSFWSSGDSSLVRSANCPPVCLLSRIPGTFLHACSWLRSAWIQTLQDSECLQFFSSITLQQKLQISTSSSPCNLVARHHSLTVLVLYWLCFCIWSVCLSSHIYLSLHLSIDQSVSLSIRLAI